MLALPQGARRVPARERFLSRARARVPAPLLLLLLLLLLPPPHVTLPISPSPRS